MNRKEAELVVALSDELEVVEMGNHTAKETDAALRKAFVLVGDLYLIARETLSGEPS